MMWLLPKRVGSFIVGMYFGVMLWEAFLYWWYEVMVR
jgi:hypothetical protein